MIQVKRAYEPVSSQDGSRYLVDRLWPRGLSKPKLKLKGWLKDIAPSEELRQWFNHDPKKWNEFRKRYKKELKAMGDQLQPLVTAARKGKVTLLFAAKDQDHNNALVLREYLLKNLKGK